MLDTVVCELQCTRMISGRHSCASHDVQEWSLIDTVVYKLRCTRMVSNRHSCASYSVQEWSLIRLTHPGSRPGAEAQLRGRAPVSQVPAVHSAAAPCRDSESPALTSSRAAYAAAPEQPVSDTSLT